MVDMVSGKYVFKIYGCNSQTAASTTSLNQWHHVGITYDGTTMRGYIDGRQVVSQTSCTRTFPTGAIHYGIGTNYGADQNPSGQLKAVLNCLHSKFTKRPCHLSMSHA